MLTCPRSVIILSRRADVAVKRKCCRLCVRTEKAGFPDSIPISFVHHLCHASSVSSKSQMLDEKNAKHLEQKVTNKIMEQVTK